MSTENEGTAVPPAPSAPPVPVDAPAASAPAPAHEPSASPAETTAPAPSAETAADSAPTTQLPPVPPTAQQPQPELVSTGAPGYAAGQGQGQMPGGGYGQAPGGAYGQAPGAPGGPAGPGGSSAPDASWPPPPPPAVPSYADNGAAAGAYGDSTGAYGDAGAAGGAGGAGGPGGPGDGGWGSSWQQTQQPAPKPAGNKRGGLIAAILVAALVAGGVGGGIGYTLADRNDNSTGSTTVSASQNGGDVKRAAGTVAAVASSALPSTVTIEASGNDGEGGTGTGFVFDKEGHIVTNNHVVAEAVDGGKVSATFPDGKKYDAEVVGHAQGYDVAVIKLKNAPSNLQPLTLGDSDKVAVGDSTIAIGAPFGLSNTVTTGIISAKNRPVASSDGSSGSKASYMSALQTDASINPGNSGGPLLDARGNVIGINSAIQSASSGGSFGSGQAGSIGLGFAIPINQAKNVAQQLIRTGKPVYPVIGASVSLEEVTGGAKITNSGEGGADSITTGGPADKAGLEPGDVITKLDDHVIDSGPTLIGEIWTHVPGDKVTLTYTRDGKTRTAEVTLGEREGDS
ncbi:S1C family serine protease [Streptomyces caniscabiei]|uniref:Trypsin-like peptidase domain-containing protein n=1 Tax=Streptomyces caniscabiei TaxID=2746961 RepID=A0ABU4MGE4_9ACTN|nr:trypsin-like peptidase domain-containing protein [Streptomyces caniscabiei]MBE4734688.1 trypsin-like peptidase domain-containing protein [Streptomyces caniscabiei]MBE4753822.1 trypsin-like peptidase domain-containing protein [Streptomyces caniscabiei]MBE4767415.1 trypsin-like peptidase domain-containing protein [Streptomyces caniscabiei]MBE4783800.1 trypsin-like peptidase domain-containing protein [Streptomyces caniscabiei]MBE4791701.1 trypsin-like peptidase domain-containing protein [Strep